MTTSEIPSLPMSGQSHLAAHAFGKKSEAASCEPLAEPKMFQASVAKDSGSLFSKPLAWFNKSASSASETASIEAAKADSVGTSFFSKLKSGLQSLAGKVKEGGCSAGLKIAKNIATYGYHPDEVDQEKIGQLKSYTRSEDLPILISTAADKIGSLLQKKIAESDQAEPMKKIVKEESLLIRQLINSGMLNIAVNLAKQEKTKKGPDDTSPVLISDLLMSVRDTLIKSLPSFEKHMEEIDKIEDPAKKEEAKRELLKPATQNLMSLAFPNGADDIVGLTFGKAKVYQLLKETVMPEILSELLKGFCKQSTQYKDAKAKLIAQLNPSGKNCEGTFKLIDSGCDFLAKKITQKIRNSAAEGSESLAQKILGNEEESAQSKALARWIAELADEKNPASSSLWELTESQVKTLLFKFLSAQIETGNFALDEKNIGKAALALFAKAAEKLHLQHGKELNFQSIAKELLAKSGISPKEDLPSMFGINQAIGDAVENKILPDLLASFHEESVSWMKKKDENIQALQTLFGTTHPKEACNFLGSYISQYIPWYLATSSDTAADLILKSFEKKIQGEESKEAKALLSEMQENRALLKTFLTGVLQTIGTTQGKPADTVWNFAKDYAESAALEIFVRIAKKMDALEKGAGNASNFSFPALIKLLKTADEKLTAVDLSAGKEGGKAMDFAAISTKLLSAATLVDAKEIPLPGLIKEEAFGLMKEETLPKALESVFSALNEDYTKDAILLGILKKLSDSYSQGSFSFGAKDTAPADPKTLALDKECGDILKSLFHKLPQSVATELFSNLLEIGIIPSEKIGQFVRGYLEKTTVLQIVDLAITKVLPQVHKGKWVGEKGQESFVPKGGKLQFDLPKTPKEKAAFDAKMERLKKIKHKKLIEEGTETIASQFTSGITGFIKSIWDKFLNGVGKISISLKNFIDGIVNNSLMQLLFSGLAWIFKPFLEAGKSAIGNALIKPALKDVSLLAKSGETGEILYSWKEKMAEMLDEGVLESRRAEKKKHELKLEELNKRQKMREEEKRARA